MPMPYKSKLLNELEKRYKNYSSELSYLVDKFGEECVERAFENFSYLFEILHPETLRPEILHPFKNEEIRELMEYSIEILGKEVNLWNQHLKNKINQN